MRSTSSPDHLSDHPIHGHPQSAWTDAPPDRHYEPCCHRNEDCAARVGQSGEKSATANQPVANASTESRENEMRTMVGRGGRQDSHRRRQSQHNRCCKSFHVKTPLSSHEHVEILLPEHNCLNKMILGGQSRTRDTGRICIIFITCGTEHRVRLRLGRCLPIGQQLWLQHLETFKQFPPHEELLGHSARGLARYGKAPRQGTAPGNAPISGLD